MDAGRTGSKAVRCFVFFRSPFFPIRGPALPSAGIFFGFCIPHLDRRRPWPSQSGGKERSDWQSRIALGLTLNGALSYGCAMKFAKSLLLPALALLFAGCMGYRTGSTLPESIQTVSLSIVNETDEPSIEVQVMRSLRAELQQDGRLEVRSQSDADAVLSVKLTRYTLTPLAYDRERGTLAREYRLTLTASVVLYDAKTGSVILESPILTGDSEFPYADDLTTAKLGALPAAADDLARKVVSTTVTAW